MEKVNYLPLGSVVYLKDGNKKVMIISRGLIMKNNGNPIFFDYGGVTYPEGMVDDKMAYFQAESISKVVFEGYRDLDDEATVDKINSFVAQHSEISHPKMEDLLNKDNLV